MKNLYQIREISVLSFNERVLQEAEDPRNPLLERLKFLGIFSSNMDEFFKVRVASIQRRIELGEKRMSELLEIVGDEARELDERFQNGYAAIKAELALEGIHIFTELDVAQQDASLDHWLRRYFRERVLPTLVPIILRPRHPFPPITDGALYFGIKMWAEKPQYAILEIPKLLPRFVELPNGNIMYIDDVIRYSLDDLFYIFEYQRIRAFEFKISRDAELDIDNDFSEDYVRKMEKVLQQRKGGRPTRLVYDAAMPAGLLQRLRSGLHVNEADTLIPGGRYHNMRDLMRFPGYRSELSFEKVQPAPHPILDELRSPIIERIQQQDILLTYPYQSFDHVIRLLREAAIDPRVDTIKTTLYRASETSQVVNALVNAARNGKRVFVSIELRARFDEENNIQIADKLREEGAEVAFGLPPIKVHSKLILIERDGERYAGLSTGNFNEVTGRLYVDSILLTANKKLTREVSRVFDVFEARQTLAEVTPPKFTHLLVSPFNTRSRLNHYIDRETEKGPEGYIFIKTNHLTDARMVKSIRTAAKAGVSIDLVVRTTYAVTPHVNIRALSILDRYLEHQRVYIFGAGDDRVVYLSSADLMERNIDWRVEVAFPILEPDLRKQIVDMMTFQVADTAKARFLDQMQSNPYVDNGGKFQSAQYKTQHYLDQLYQQCLKSPAPPAEKNATDDDDEDD